MQNIQEIIKEKLRYLEDKGVKSSNFELKLMLANLLNIEVGNLRFFHDNISQDTLFDMVDVNLRAVKLAKQNAINNNTLNVNVFESNVYENVKNKYDLIITNPPIRAGKSVVHNILLNGIEHLNDLGELWCVIQKKQGAPSAIKAMEEVYSKVEVVAKEKGYYIIKGVK